MEAPRVKPESRELFAHPPIASGLITVVMPVRDGLPLLRVALPSVVDAVRADGNAELIVVDNGSTDGAYEFVQRTLSSDGRVLSHPGVRVGEVRNTGARIAGGTILVFLDADCLVKRDYLSHVRRVFANSTIAATGASYDLPSPAHWIERAWFGLHRKPVEVGDVAHISAGNFAVRRQVFDAIGGFDGGLQTGEDAELCQRLRRAGHRIVQDRRVSAVHLGNPKTLYAFFRKQTWHAMGMFGTVSVRSVDRPTAMLFLHLILIGGAVLLVAVGSAPVVQRLIAAAALVWLVPTVTVLYRAVRSHGVGASFGAVLLYQLYYLARARALVLLAIGSRAERRA
jgi:glycosyltransferase involved in cell wall biosynthesis